MKKKFALFVIPLLAMAVLPLRQAVAQHLGSEATIELLAGEQDKVFIEKIQLNKDGTVTIIGLAQRLGQLLTGGESKYRPDKPHAYYPALLKYELSEKLQLSSKLQENFHLSSLQDSVPAPNPYLLVTASNEILGQSTTDKPFASLQAEYPDVFTRSRPEAHKYEPAEYMLAGPLLAHTTTLYRYDPESNSFLETIREEIIPLEFPVEDRKSLYVHDRIKVAQHAGLVSMVSGQKEDDSRSYQHYKHQQLRLYNLNGRLLRQHSLSFDYPSEMRLHEFIRNEHGEEAGATYVFGAARRYGQQQSDPDPANYELLCLDREGREKFRHRYRYGSASTASEPFFATLLKDQLLVLGKGVGREPDFHLLIFDKDSLKKATRIDQSIFYETIVGDYRLSLEQSYASQYQVSDSKVLDDGSIIFWGEHRVLLEGAGWNLQSNRHHKPTYEYKSYVFLHFNQEGDLISNYVLERDAGSLLNRPASISLLSADTHQLQLLLSEPFQSGSFQSGSRQEPGSSLTKAEDGEYQEVEGANARKVSNDYPDRQLRPMVISIRPDAQKLEVLRFADNFLSLDKWGMLHDPQRKELLLVGTSANKEASQKLIIKKVKL